MKYFCPSCWTELTGPNHKCPSCGALPDMDYSQSLRMALHSPDYQTRRRAAFVLGKRHDTSATQALIETLQDDPDPYVAAEAAGALAALGTEEALAALKAAKAHRFVIVRSLLERLG